MACQTAIATPHQRLCPAWSWPLVFRPIFDGPGDPSYGRNMQPTGTVAKEGVSSVPNSGHRSVRPWAVSKGQTNEGQTNGTGLILDDLGRVSETVGMPRTARVVPGGMVFHVLKRGGGRMRRFLMDVDFEAFERVVEKTFEYPPDAYLHCTQSNFAHPASIFLNRSGRRERRRGTNSAHCVFFCSKSGCFGCGRRRDKRTACCPIIGILSRADKQRPLFSLKRRVKLRSGEKTLSGSLCNPLNGNGSNRGRRP